MNQVIETIKSSRTIRRFSMLDCGAAAQNMLLAVESMNIGSIIMTSGEFLFTGKDSDEIKNELGIPQGYRHISVVALGYM